MTDTSANVFEQLLEVQRHDTAIDQLTHKRATLAAREQLVAADAKLAALDREASGVQAQRDELSGQQSLLEDQVLLVENKITAEDAKLYSGSVTGVKELQALQDEIASLKRRQGSLEDDIIVVMEAAEPVDAELDSIAARRASSNDDREKAVADIAAAEAEIDGELATEAEARTAAVAGIDADLLDTYDRIRADTGGVGIARFVGGRCEGCHLALPAMEVDQIKKQAADVIVTCSSCERILVH